MKINKLIYVMFCMFFCGCVTASTISSFENVQRKDNSEPLKLGTIVHYSNELTNFCVIQVLNNQRIEFDNDGTNTYYVSQMVLVSGYNKRLFIDDRRYMSAFIIPSKGFVYSNEQSIAKGYYMYIGNYTYKTISKNPNGSYKYKTVRVFYEVDAPIDNTK